MSEEPWVSDNGFWWHKPLAELSSQQWEQLCDGCGKCCLHKLMDDNSDTVFFTAVACRFLDAERVRCRCYAQRAENNPECLVITPANISQLADWLPATCAYRLRFSGQSLPQWHPLITGSQQSVADAGQSVRYRCINETDVSDSQDWEELILADLI